MSDALNDEQIRRLVELLEHEGLEAFLPYAEQAAAEAKISAARQLVWRVYRQMFIALVGAILALATFWEKTTAGAGAFIKWLAGQ